MKIGVYLKQIVYLNVCLPVHVEVNALRREIATAAPMLNLTVHLHHDTKCASQPISLQQPRLSDPVPVSFSPHLVTARHARAPKSTNLLLEATAKQNRLPMLGAASQPAWTRLEE